MKKHSDRLKVRVVVAHFQLPPRPESTSVEAYAGKTASLCFFLFLPLSRAGLCTFELTTQELIQITVSPTYISASAGTRKSLQSICELMRWVATAARINTFQFRWLVLGSLDAIGTAVLSYAVWVVTRCSMRKCFNATKRVDFLGSSRTSF
jgi:hypothetical protein